MDQIRMQNERNSATAQTTVLTDDAAKYLKANKEKIKVVWEKKVREKVSVSESQTSLALLNSIEIFLDELIITLEDTSLTYSDLGERGMAKVHGGQRAKFVGYFLPQLLKEFSILREVLIRDFKEQNLLSFPVVMITNNSIDAAISLAATEFASVQQANMKTALQNAEASNRNLEQFAAVAAHDLKSPLATISGYLDLLRTDAHEYLKKESLDYIGIMERAILRMHNLIEGLLEYAQLTQKNRPFGPVDLEEVIKAVVQNLHSAKIKTHAEIECSRLPIVHGDTELLTQLFQNLIANSLKFHGDRAPKIQVECLSQEDHYLFSVTDHGIGFASGKSKDIFDLYTKVGGDAHEGAGIGLATCKKVVELHGGKIWAESIPGQGATFYFTLPPSDTSDLQSH